MIYLAYDGSINGDWVSRYAIHLASHATERTLTLVHILDGTILRKSLDTKIRRIESECRAQEIELLPKVLPLDRNVLHSLVNAIPRRKANLVVCGTRIRSRQRAYLTGTITEKLLRIRRFDLLAIRVVQPGLLGTPREFLLPLTGDPHDFSSAWPFLRLFLPEVDRVFLLRGIKVSSFRLHHLSPHHIRALRNLGKESLQAFAKEIQSSRGASEFYLNSRVVVCDDWVRTILVHASDLKVRMILLKASKDILPHHFIRGGELERLLRGTPCDVGIYQRL